MDLRQSKSRRQPIAYEARMLRLAWRYGFTAGTLGLLASACLADVDRQVTPQESPLLGTKAGAPPNCGTGSCGAGLLCCNDVCIDPFNNEDHCGNCGNACDSGDAPYCFDGVCACAELGSVAYSCTGSYGTCCGNKGSASCVDTTTDPSNCGGCDGPSWEGVCRGTCQQDLTCGEAECVEGECFDECTPGRDPSQTDPECG